ncbi:hypothetical protein [Rhodocyclus gracilis]|uniref:Uncharacterized protein n=1 Tax=Rhodocyclus tenuis TaxID=1066 RepID=A0A6L5JYP0_RHOTE|nr:hypothetical protein [Rhodocyclus gracilis]MQY52455.1 hypothetical protein [Rhodocyclus gracilis]
MAYDYDGSFREQAAYARGRAETSRPSDPVDKYLGGGTALENFRLKEENATLKEQIQDLQRRLVGTKAVRDTLKNALREVQPNHPLIVPFSGNPTLVAIAERAIDEASGRT